MDQEDKVEHETDGIATQGIRKRNAKKSVTICIDKEKERSGGAPARLNGCLRPVISNGSRDHAHNSEEEEEDDDEDEDEDDRDTEEDDGEEDAEGDEDTEDKTETEQENGTLKTSQDTSPVHTHNSQSVSNVFGEDDDGEDYGGYNDFDYEYVPKIREPPSDEDSEDGLLVSTKDRDAALSGIAKALLESAKTNQEAYEKEKLEQENASFYNGVIHICGGNSRLMSLEDMPPHLQFNRFVHSGYRDVQNAWGCFLSLFYIHNETVNILTHVAPIIYVLIFWRTMYPWKDIEGNMFLNVLGWSHIIASISPWTGSVFYHLFMNHNAGPKFYQILLQIDMFGIWVTECFGALTNLTAATWCLPRNLQNYIMVAYGMAAVWGLQKALTAWTPLARRICFAPVFISRILAFFLRISFWGGGDSTILIHVILQDVVSVIGGTIGVIRIPEKWFPGKLDIFINSHHIMHVLVVVAVVHMNLASNGDIRWIIDNYSQAQCSNPL